jgi:hypothetical protein
LQAKDRPGNPTFIIRQLLGPTLLLLNWLGTCGHCRELAARKRIHPHWRVSWLLACLGCLGCLGWGALLTFVFELSGCWRVLNAQTLIVAWLAGDLRDCDFLHCATIAGEMEPGKDRQPGIILRGGFDAAAGHDVELPVGGHVAHRSGGINQDPDRLCGDVLVCVSDLPDACVVERAGQFLVRARSGSGAGLGGLDQGDDANLCAPAPLRVALADPGRMSVVRQD